jgi:hypothetical protein
VHLEAVAMVDDRKKLFFRPWVAQHSIQAVFNGAMFFRGRRARNHLNL